MKKLFLALLAVGSITAANAQKNTILTYGNVGVMVNNRDEGSGLEHSFTDWNINPGIGYQFHKNMTVGVQGGYMYSEHVTKAPFLGTSLTTQMQQSEWSAGAFYRYTHYFSPMFALWGQLDLSYISGRAAADSVGTTSVVRIKDDYNGFSAMITPAFAINVHDGWALNFGIGGLGYRTTTWDGGFRFGSTDSRFMFTFGQQFNVGISKNWGCGKKHHTPMEPGMDTRKHKHDHDDDEDDE